MSTETQPTNFILDRPNIVLSGISHKETNIEIREKLAVQNERLPSTLIQVSQVPGIAEAVLISTCNRTELVTAELKQTDIRHEEIFEQFSGIKRNTFNEQLYIYRDRAAVSHLFRVASGLDSMVIGEPQILGQLKSSYKQALSHGTTATCLNRLFHKAFRVAKIVRSRTEIGRRAVSIAFAARLLAEQIFADISSAKVLLIGAGETGQLILRHFYGSGVRTIFVANRTLDKATRIAHEYHAIPLELSSISQILDRVDIIICAAEREVTQSFFVQVQQATQAISQRQGQPQFYIDLSVPRGIDPAIDKQQDAFLYNIDHLDQIVKDNHFQRAQEAGRAEKYIDHEVDNFCNWLASFSVEKAIADISERADRDRKIEISKTLRRLGRNGLVDLSSTEVEAALDDLTRSTTAKLLHQPMTSVKEDPELLTAFRKILLGRD